MALAMNRSVVAKRTQQPAVARARAPVARALVLSRGGPGQNDAPKSLVQLLASFVRRPDANDAAAADR
jgi:hypothetical protein